MVLPWIAHNLDEYTNWSDKPVVKGVNDRILRYLEVRTQLGIRRYGTPLMTFTNRRASRDAVAEVADAVQYFAQWYMELMETPDKTDEQVRIANMVERLYATQLEVLGDLLSWTSDP